MTRGRVDGTLGVAEYLFRSRSLLTSAISAALGDRLHRPEDVEFVVAARGWSECVSFGNFELYRKRFQATAGESIETFQPTADIPTTSATEMGKLIVGSLIRRFFRTAFRGGDEIGRKDDQGHSGCTGCGEEMTAYNSAARSQPSITISRFRSLARLALFKHLALLSTFEVSNRSTFPLSYIRTAISLALRISTIRAIGFRHRK